MKNTVILLALLISFYSCTKEYYITEQVNPENIETINVVRESANDDSIPNVTPDDGIDDSPGIQVFIDNNPGKILFFEKGNYDLETPIFYCPETTISTTENMENKAGLKIVGDGMNNTVFNNKTGDYAIKVLGTKGSKGRILIGRKQIGGFFKNFSIYNKLNPRGLGGFMLVGARGFEFENIGILGGFGGKRFSHAIYIPIIEDIISTLTKEGLSESATSLQNRFRQHLQNKEIYNYGTTHYTRSLINGDPYHTSITINNMVIDNCIEYGIYGENGTGFDFQASRLKISRCDKAGIYIAGHNSRFISGYISACGKFPKFANGVNCTDDLHTGGIIIDRLGAVPNNFVVENVEFDNNYPNHIQIRSLANGSIKNNRFISGKSYSDLTDCSDTTNCNYVRIVGIKQGNYYWPNSDDSFVKNNEISNNFFRLDGDQFFAIELGSFRAKYSIFDNNKSDNTSTSYNTLNYYTDTNSSNDCSYEGDLYYASPGFNSTNSHNYLRHNGEVLID